MYIYIYVYGCITWFAPPLSSSFSALSPPCFSFFPGRRSWQQRYKPIIKIPVFRDALFLRHPLSFVGEKGSGSEARLLFSSSPSLYNIHSRSQKVETSKIILFYRDDAPFTASFNLEIDERAGNKQIVEKRVKRE